MADVNAKPQPPATIEVFQKGVARAVDFDDMETAWKFADEIRDIFKEQPFSPTDPWDVALESARVLLDWVALPHGGLTRALELLSNSVIPALLAGIDVQDKVTTTVVTLILNDERDEWKKKMREQLLTNAELLTSKVVPTPQGELSTVSDWLRFYFRHTVDQPKLARAQFLLKSEVTQLSELERAALKKLVGLFDYLSSSSMSIEGLEESVSVIDDAGTLRVLKHGQLETVREDPVVMQAIAFLKRREAEEAAAVESARTTHFMDRAKTGVLSSAEFLTDEEWERASVYAEAHGAGQRFAAARRQEILSVEDLATVLRAWYETREHMDPDAAMTAAISIVNAMNEAGFPEYLGVVYFDSAEKHMRWKGE